MLTASSYLLKTPTRFLVPGSWCRVLGWCLMLGWCLVPRRYLVPRAPCDAHSFLRSYRLVRKADAPGTRNEEPTRHEAPRTRHP
jgi:hypothetical protein